MCDIVFFSKETFFRSGGRVNDPGHKGTRFSRQKSIRGIVLENLSVMYNQYMNRFKGDKQFVLSPNDDDVWECGFADYILNNFVSEQKGDDIIVFQEALYGKD